MISDITISKKLYNADCRDCPRLAAFLDEVRVQQPEYFARPVPAFGDEQARVLVVGLAPGMHGANATGRPFTGDYAGLLLYETLHELGVASKPESVHVDDGLILTGVRITNAVKCLPPANKPTTEEMKTCNRFLRAELAALPSNTVLLALGKIAHDAVLRAFDEKLSKAKFGHAAEHVLASGRKLIDSYHCSRYNTQTRRLTPEMFKTVVARALEMTDE